ncbi:hypothetical protein PFISCL1PPCAC_22201, partial [Pristionchus fissidentatus]
FQPSSTLSEWGLLVCLFLFPALNTYSAYSIGALLPSIQYFFSISDSSAASIMTFVSVAHGLGLGAMWLFGDMIPKRATFFTVIFLSIAFLCSSVLVGTNQFWLFAICLASASFF